MNYKKVNIFILILLLFIISLNAISANENMTDDNIQTDNMDNNIKSINEYQVHDKNIKTEQIEKDVNNYNQLSKGIAESENPDLTINLKGNQKYYINETINVDDNINNLIINGYNRIIDGSKNHSFMIVQNVRANIVISNVTFINCNGDFGPVFYNRANLTLKDCSFYNNTANSEGGVIYNVRNLSIDNCIFDNNDGGKRGGVINNHKNLEVTNCIINNSRATNGGVFYLYGNTNNTISNNNINNSKSDFAAVFFVYGTGNITILNNNISNTAVTRYGGIILNHGCKNSNISHNKISNSNASWGSVIMNLNNLNLSDNEFINNSASYGGVIFNDGNMNLSKNNFTNNTASIGSCVYNGAEANIELNNNRFINNMADDGAVIYNSGYCNFTENTLIANKAKDTDGYVIKSDEDLISDDSEHIITIKNNIFINNTDYKRDMLLSNNGELYISDNTYTGNYLDLNCSKLDKLSYNDNVNFTLKLTPKSIYNTTVNTGNISCIVNNKTNMFSVNNNMSTIYLTPKSLDSQNIFNITYEDGLKSFNMKNQVYNISVYKNTMINIKIADKIKYHDTLNIEADITDMDKKAVNKGYVIYKINGITLKENNSIIKTNVKNGSVNLSYDLPSTYNVKNYTLEIVYAGNSNYNASRNTSTFNIIQTKEEISVTSDKKSLKMDENITFIARIKANYDINIGVMLFKVNGVTVKDKNNNPILVEVKNNTANLTFTIPDGWSAKSIKVTAVYSNKNYQRMENSTYFNIIKTTPKFDITLVKLSTNSIRVSGNIIDNYGHNVRGINAIIIKINSLSIKKSNNQTQNFIITNGVIDINYELSMNLKLNNYTLEFVTGERNAYNSTRLIMKVKNY